MKEVIRHKIDLEVVKRNIVARHKTFLLTLQVAKKDGDALSQLLTVARSYAGYLSVIEPESPELCMALRIGAQAANAIFTTASSASGAVQVLLENDLVQLPAIGTTSTSYAGNWMSGLFMAIICQDGQALHTLIHTPVSVLRQSSTKGDECMYLFVEALQGFLKRDRETSSYLLKALEATDPDRLSIDPEYVLSILVPEIDLLYRILEMDATAYNQALEKALEKHRQYWSKGQRKTNPSGYLALGPLAMSVCAINIGIPIEVESDYLPMRLVKGDCKG